MAKLLSLLTKRQKATMIMCLLILAFLVWQIIALSNSDVASAADPAVPAAPPPPMPTPKLMQLFKDDKSTAPAATLSPQADEQMKTQQAFEEKYVQAFNELQMLKITKEIADANLALTTTKLATAKAQKDMMDVFVPAAAPPASSAANHSLLDNATNTDMVISRAKKTETASIKYKVVSVAKVRNKWSAVLSDGITMYAVTVGDILPQDGAKVVGINRKNVMLHFKDGKLQKISLVSTV